MSIGGHKKFWLEFNNVFQGLSDLKILKTYSNIKLMKVETTNLTSVPLCLTVIGILTREIAVQVCEQTLTLPIGRMSLV